MNNRYKYLYKVTHPNTNEFYVGSRVSKLEPHLDVEYKGSMITWKPNKKELIKEILVIFDLNTSKDKLCECESDLIGLVIDHPLNRNYNIPRVGFFNKGNSIETNKKISDSKKGKNNSMYGKDLPMLGKNHTQKTKELISEKLRNLSYRAELNEKLSKIHTGKKLSDGAKLKVSLFNKGKILSQETKDKISSTRVTHEVHQYSLSGEFMRTWRGCREAAKFYGCNRTAIQRCCLGYSKTSCNFIWKFKDKINK